MIYVYGILYYYLEYALKSIESLLSCCTEPINLTVIDSKSARSPEIISTLKNYDTRISQIIAFKDNVRGWGFNKTYMDFRPDNSEDFFVFTDLDFTVDFDWIKETRRLQKEHPITGYSLKMDNYAPPNCGFSPVNFSTQLIGIRKKDWESKYLYKQAYVDGQCISILGNPGKSDKELYHLGWDTWKDYPELWEHKLKGTDWMAAPTSLAYQSWNNNKL